MSKEVTVMSREQIEAQDEVPISHPLNPLSDMHYRPLTENAGFEQVGLHMIRVPPGKESNELHSHRYEEEFYYVLEGQGVLLVGDDSHDMGPGSFAAFPAGSAAHMLTNPSGTDLLYLTGGRRSPFEIGEFPRHGKTLIRAGADAYMIDNEALERPSFWPGGDEE